MNKIQIIVSVENRNIRVDIPINIYQSVNNDCDNGLKRKEFIDNSCDIIKERYTDLYNIIEHTLSEKGIDLKGRSYRLITDFFNLREDVCDANYRIVSYWDKELATEILKLWNNFFSVKLTIDDIYDFAYGDKDCNVILVAVFVKTQFVGFAQVLRYKNVSFINMLVIKHEWQNKGIGTRLLRYIGQNSDCPIMSVSKVITDSDDYSKYKHFYAENGYVRMPIKMPLRQFGDLDVYVKGALIVDEGIKLIENVQWLWDERF